MLRRFPSLMPFIFQDRTVVWDYFPSRCHLLNYFKTESWKLHTFALGFSDNFNLIIYYHLKTKIKHFVKFKDYRAGICHISISVKPGNSYLWNHAYRIKFNPTDCWKCQRSHTCCLTWIFHRVPHVSHCPLESIIF